MTDAEVIAFAYKMRDTFRRLEAAMHAATLDCRDLIDVLEARLDPEEDHETIDVEA